MAAPFDAAGKLNYQTTAFPLPQLKGNVFAEYSHGAHNIRYTHELHRRLRRISAYRAVPAVSGDTNGLTISAGKTIDSTIFHDLHYLVQLPWETALSLSVENFTDEDPSFARLDLSYDPFTSSALGSHLQGGIAQALRCGVKGNAVRGMLTVQGRLAEPPFLFGSAEFAHSGSVQPCSHGGSGPNVAARKSTNARTFGVRLRRSG